METSDITLLLPQHDTESPTLSIVIPALNEEITVGQFVDWCKQGIAAAGISAEILIIDQSTDRTAEVAVSRGARVLKRRSAALGAPTSMRSRISAASMSCSAMRIAPMIFASLPISLRSFVKVISSSWARVSKARSRKVRCRRCIATSVHR